MCWDYVLSEVERGQKRKKLGSVVVNDRQDMSSSRLIQHCVDRRHLQLGQTEKQIYMQSKSQHQYIDNRPNNNNNKIIMPASVLRLVFIIICRRYLRIVVVKQFVYLATIMADNGSEDRSPVFKFHMYLN